LFKMWCGGELCKENLNRFHFTCLYCRWRRKYLGKWTDPPYWIEYSYLSQTKTFYTNSYNDKYKNLEYYSSDGSKFEITEHWTLRIDPRGYFTKLRCAAIIVLDKIMLKFSLGKPFVELCEFLSNYP
jgi:hypothetical protein